jgi:hypothetical protein
MARQDHKIIDPPGQRLTMKYAAFLHKAGRIKTMPESWKDYFWPLAHGLKGS